MKKSKTVLKLLGFLVLFPAVLLAWSKTTSLSDYKKGLEFYQQGRYEQALERFELAIDENFDFWQSYQMVGYCYFELREKESAMKAFEESLRINPRNPKLAKIYHDIKAGVLDVPVRPVVYDPRPTGTPVYLKTF